MQILLFMIGIVGLLMSFMGLVSLASVQTVFQANTAIMLFGIGLIVFLLSVIARRLNVAPEPLDEADQRKGEPKKKRDFSRW